MKIKLIQRKRDEKFLSQFIKVKEAADILGKTRNTVYARMREGKLNAVLAFKGTPAEETFFYRDQVEALANAT